MIPAREVFDDTAPAHRALLRSSARSPTLHASSPPKMPAHPSCTAARLTVLATGALAAIHTPHGHKYARVCRQPLSVALQPCPVTKLTGADQGGPHSLLLSISLHSTVISRSICGTLTLHVCKRQSPRGYLIQSASLVTERLRGPREKKFIVVLSLDPLSYSFRMQIALISLPPFLKSLRPITFYRTELL